MKLKKKPTLGKVTKTNRGFEIVEFKDSYAKRCRLQESSIVGEPHIWLGIDSADPLILRLHAGKLGIPGGTDYPAGWMSYPVPEEVFISTQMHLNPKQVKGLVTHLQAWLKTQSMKA